MANHYDLVVIGAGPGGYVAAARGASMGLKTAIVEKDPALGGTCLHRGCIPTKALLHAADTYDEIKHGARIGIKASGVEIDWGEVQKYKERVVSSNAGGVSHLMKSKKIDVFHGVGRLKDKNTVEISGEKEAKSIKSKFIVLAVGSTPKNLPMAEPNSRILNSDTILGLKKIPGSLTIVGGGVIGIEFASIFARFGSKVKVIEALPRILATADADCSKELRLQLEKQGVTFHVDAKIEKVSNKSDQAHVIFSEADGSSVQVDSDYVLVSVGRAPLTENLGLETTNIKRERGYIGVDGHLRTDEPNIYAIGDCINTPWLAHVASKEGIIAVEHLAGLKPSPLNYDHTPCCVYSEPPVAWAGLTEEQAKERGHDIKIGKFDFARNAKASILQKNRGFVKFITDKKYGEILGVHIIGPEATEILAEPAFAMQTEATIDQIADTVHAHPTLYESIYEAALSAVDKPIHG
ncbi:MAG TPA: dihydrolipoyl dehydrogenase [Myxococcota bacterium]|nr:dihydrolipoyl dehydrogenase [Myxococcota bacterium]